MMPTILRRSPLLLVLAIVSPFALAAQQATGTVSGRVTDEAGNPIAGLFVNVFRPALPFYFVAGATTDGDGRYSVLVPAGSYKVLFPSNGGPFLDEWWNDKGSFETATTVDVAASVGAIDAVLARGIVISGHIRTSDGTPLAGAIANLSDGTTTCCTLGSPSKTIRSPGCGELTRTKLECPT